MENRNEEERPDFRFFEDLLLQDRVKWCEMPDWLKNDRDFIRDVIYSGCIGTNKEDYPSEWLEDVEFATIILGLRSDDADPLTLDELQRETQFLFTWYEYPPETKYHPDVIRKALMRRRIKGWDDIPPDLQQNKDVACAALASECPNARGSASPLRRSDVPWVDDDFVIQRMRDGVAIKDERWSLVPAELRTDIEFARSLPDDLIGTLLAYGIFQSIPPLRNDLDFWRRVLENAIPDPDFHLFFVGEHFTAPDALLRSSDLMQLAIRKDEAIIKYADNKLINDHRFVEHILDECPKAFFHLRNNQKSDEYIHTVTERLPSLSKKILESGDNNVDGYFKRREFRNQSFRETWLRSGLPLPSKMGRRFRNERDVFLLTAEHCHVSHRFASFRLASRSLREERAFMLKAMDYDPALFAFAEGKVKKDKALRLLAYGSPQECFQRYVDARLGTPGFAEERAEMSQYVVTKFENYKQFISFLSCGLSYSVRDVNTIFLWMQQGNETTTSLKRMIGAYLGAPFGQDLIRVVQAQTNLLTDYLRLQSILNDLEDRKNVECRSRNC